MNRIPGSTSPLQSEDEEWTSNWYRKERGNGTEVPEVEASSVEEHWRECYETVVEEWEETEFDEIVPGELHPLDKSSLTAKGIQETLEYASQHFDEELVEIRDGVWKYRDDISPLARMYESIRSIKSEVI